MDDAALTIRIRVIVASTRAALRSVGPGDTRAAVVVERGQGLLDGLGPSVRSRAGSEVRQLFNRARLELDSMQV